MTSLCSKCGNLLNIDAKYCSNCGKFTAYSTSSTVSYDPTLPISPPQISSQVPSTDYGSSSHMQQNLYEPFNPYSISYSPPPPPPLHKHSSMKLKALTFGSIVFLVVVSSLIYYTVVFLPSHLHTQIAPTSFAITPVPTPFTYTSEAEAPTNTLIGNAGVFSCADCSGRLKVGYVGNNSGELQFNNVSVGNSGIYTLTIYYCSAEARNAFMSLNGEAGIQLAFSSTGDWNVPGQLNFSIKLNVGSNTIKFYNPVGWAPDFDKITVASQ